MSGNANSRTRADVLAAVDDLFFFAKIEAAAKAAGTNVLLASDPRQMQALLAGSVPGLVILDLNSKVFDPLDMVRSIKTDTRLAHTRVIGFYSHVQVDLRRAAEEAGCDQVLPRSVFVAQLQDILKG